jgi:rhomboid protease GluP
MQHEAAQRGEVGEDAKQYVMPAPWVRRETAITLTKVFFGINVAVFVAMAFAGVSITDPTGEELVRWGANAGRLTLAGEWWRLLTCVFLHIGIIHLAFNMWCLWDLGALCESLYGSWTFGAVYLISGVGASLTSTAWRPNGLSAGASGAIFGLAGALISSFYLGEFSLPSVAVKGTLRSVVMFAGYNLLFGAVSGRTDNAAHVGGLVTGLILGALVARVAPEHDNPLRRFVVISVVALAVFAAGLGVQHWRGGPMRFGRISSENNLDRMIAVLRKKVQQSPEDASAHYALAHAYFVKGEVPQAEAELKRVLELQPQNSKARMELGAAYLSQDQPKAAQDEFTRLLTQDPSNAGAHVGLGVALAAEQNPAAAIGEYKTALQLDPQAEGVYYRMGNSQAQLKQYDDAIASYLKEREKNGDAADLEDALADAYQAKGMTQQAEEARTKAAQLKGSSKD